MVDPVRCFCCNRRMTDRGCGRCGLPICVVCAISMEAPRRRGFMQYYLCEECTIHDTKMRIRCVIDDIMEFQHLNTEEGIQRVTNWILANMELFDILSEHSITLVQKYLSDYCPEPENPNAKVGKVAWIVSK